VAVRQKKEQRKRAAAWNFYFFLSSGACNSIKNGINSLAQLLFMALCNSSLAVEG